MQSSKLQIFIITLISFFNTSLYAQQLCNCVCSDGSVDALLVEELTSQAALKYLTDFKVVVPPTKSTEIDLTTGIAPTEYLAENICSSEYCGQICDLSETDISGRLDPANDPVSPFAPSDLPVYQ